MALNFDGLMQTLGTRERAADSAMQGLGPNSTVVDVTKAGHLINLLPVFVTAVTNALKGEIESKMAPVRSMAPR